MALAVVLVVMAMGTLTVIVDEAGRAAWATTGRYVRGIPVVAPFDAIGIAGALLFVPLAAAGSAAGHVLWERRHGADA